MMRDDKQMIRDLIANWLRASAAGDLAHVLSLMAEDAIFLTPGQPPMCGRDAFAAGFQMASHHFHIGGVSDVREVTVAGDVAYSWSHLTVTLTPLEGGPPKRRSGHTLTVWRRQPEGNWLLIRDANMLTPEPAV